MLERQSSTKAERNLLKTSLSGTSERLYSGMGSQSEKVLGEYRAAGFESVGSFAKAAGGRVSAEMR